MRRVPALVLLGLAVVTASAWGQATKQPEVTPGPNGSDWDVRSQAEVWPVHVCRLAQPMKTTKEATPGLFKKAGPGPVVFRPAIALGLETKNRGGWYAPTQDDHAPRSMNSGRIRGRTPRRTWTRASGFLPPLADGSTTSFDPGDKPFGLCGRQRRPEETAWCSPSLGWWRRTTLALPVSLTK